MTNRSRVLALAGLLWAAPTLAVTTPQYPVPYLGGGASTLSPDSVRKSDAVGGGYQVFLGFPVQWLTEGQEAFEIRLLDHQMRRVDGKDNFQTGLSADYVYDLGSSVQEVGFFSGTKLFALAGLTFVQEDNFGVKQNVYGLSGGLGLLIPLGFKGWGIRLDGRVQAENNSKTCDSTAVSAGLCESEASNLIDYFFSAGLQIPLTMFFDKPKPLPPPKEDCPVSVVDPDSPESDKCAADGDRDGVPDGDDQCPGTAVGQPVDERGCSR